MKKKFWIAAIVFVVALLQMGMVAMASGKTQKTCTVDGNAVEVTINLSDMEYIDDGMQILINKHYYTDYIAAHGSFARTVTAIYTGSGSAFDGNITYDYNVTDVPQGVYVRVTATLEKNGDSKEAAFDLAFVNIPSPHGDSDGEEHESHSSKHHDDSYSEYTYKEVDGQLEFGGMVNGNFASTSYIPASAYPKFNDWAVKKLEGLTASGKESSGSGEGDDGRIVIKCGAWNSFPEKVMQAINSNTREVELIYKAADGQIYSILIPSGTDVLQYVDENGYCGLSFLGSKIGQHLYTEE